jgi:hypothetical protein
LGNSKLDLKKLILFTIVGISLSAYYLMVSIIDFGHAKPYVNLKLIVNPIVKFTLSVVGFIMNAIIWYHSS